MNWQPIETAPKDAFILVVADGAQVVAYYDIGMEGYRARMLPSEYGRLQYITHWMPLPPPPS